MTNSTSSFWTTFMPHGHCYLWRPDILWLHVISDTFIALAYFSIPIGLYLILRKRPKTIFKPLIIMFSLFITACGVSHLLNIWTVWHGDYGLLGLSKGITAVISVATALSLLPKLPEIASLKSAEDLEVLNEQLRDEINIQRDSTEKLGEAELQFRTYIQHAPDGILIAHPSGKIEYSNDMANLMYGYSPSELDNQSVVDLIPQKFKHLLDAADNKSLDIKRALAPLAHAEFSGLRKDGSEFPMEIHLSTIKSNEANVYVVTLRDISMRKANEEDARKQFIELAHVTRLSTVGQMAAGLAHELNQPLTAISNNIYTAMAMEKKKDTPDKQLLEMMGENYESAQRAGQIIRSLRQLVRKEDGNRQITNVNDLITTTIKLVKPEARAVGVELQLDLDDNLPASLLDAIQIQQVIVNLARNAIEALAESNTNNGMVTINTTKHNDNSIAVYVSDNGPGLSANARQKLFQPYFTSKDAGMGVGLSICRSIVESQGGDMWHQDSEHYSAMFCFTLPIVEAKK